MTCYCFTQLAELQDNEASKKCCDEAGGKWGDTDCDTYSMTRTRRLRFQACCIREGEKSEC
ncbi:hypothetical protein QBC37DRAFT_376293 [Rhypophila decipiens]|uniref:Uncharacterized protein n=1 Tax=Rhypophila decipiens TaxID=261697 RepID=A0AAN6Y2U1_9PEZI|nr:hypothetical protein QBC37DRAFT_376293 [Rhypophila decipiens]